MFAKNCHLHWIASRANILSKYIIYIFFNFWRGFCSSSPLPKLNNLYLILTKRLRCPFFKDTQREKAPSNKTPALTKSTKMGIWVGGTSNQLFIRGSKTVPKFSKKMK